MSKFHPNLEDARKLLSLGLDYGFSHVGGTTKVKREKDGARTVERTSSSNTDMSTVHCNLTVKQDRDRPAIAKIICSGTGEDEASAFADAMVKLNEIPQETFTMTMQEMAMELVKARQAANQAQAAQFAKPTQRAS